MAKDYPVRVVSGWCQYVALAALVCCLLPVTALAQGDAASHSSPTKQSSTHSTSAKQTAKGKGGAKSTASSKRPASSAKTHSTASHANSTAIAASRGAKGKRAKSRNTARRGQQKIDAERAGQIQEALIREHYLTGEASGKWDQSSEDALRRYQADHGWQSKMVPDSRALISLGLGPSHDHLLNPDSAMTTGPEVSRPAAVESSTAPPVSHSAEPAPSSGVPAAPVDPPTASSSEHESSSPQK